MPKFSAYLRGAQGPSGRSIFNGSYETTTSISTPEEGSYIIGTSDPKAVWTYSPNQGGWKFEGYYGHKLSVLNVSTSTVSYSSNANVSIDLIKDKTGTNDSLNFHFDIPSMKNGGVINGPLELSQQPASNSSEDQVATLRYVRTKGLYHVTISNVSSSGTRTVNGVTEAMRIVNCRLSAPENISSDINWTTGENLINLQAAFIGATNIDLDLMEVNPNNILNA